jgi:hypothetical protein
MPTALTGIDYSLQTIFDMKKHYYFIAMQWLLGGLMLSFASVQNGHAQGAANYFFSQSVGTYTPITGAAVYGTATTDEQRFVDPAVNNASTSAYTPLASTSAITPTHLRNRVAAFSPGS